MICVKKTNIMKSENVFFEFDKKIAVTENTFDIVFEVDISYLITQNYILILQLNDINNLVNKKEKPNFLTSSIKSSLSYINISGVRPMDALMRRMPYDFGQAAANYYLS